MKTYAGRKGWRLPKTDEIASLLAPKEERQALPRRHPFDIGRDMFRPVGGAFYIRGKTPVEEDPDEPQLRVWCVRGPSGTADGM